jgi:hypothetical protein
MRIGRFTSHRRFIQNPAEGIAFSVFVLLSCDWNHDATFDTLAGVKNAVEDRLGEQQMQDVVQHARRDT